MNDKNYWLQSPERWFSVKGALFNPVRFFLAQRDRKVTKILQQYSWNSLCDVGCGSGDYLTSFANKEKIIGVDYSEKMLSLAKKNKQNNFHLCCGNATQIPLKNNAVDALVAIGLTDYLNNIEPFLKECFRIAKHTIIFTAPSTYSPFFFLRFHPFLFFRRHFLGIPNIDNSYTKERLIHLLNKHNIKQKEIFNFFGTMWLVVGVKHEL